MGAMEMFVNDHGLLVNPETNRACGYIFNFSGHGAYAPDGKVGDLSQEAIDTHNQLLATAEWETMLQRGKGMLYLTKSNNHWTVSDWPGVHKLPVYSRSTSFHNFAGPNGRTDIWFYINNEQWHGVNIGDNDMCRVKRNKGKR